MTEVISLDPNDFSTQIYDSKDENLILSFEKSNVFTTSSYIEFNLISLNKDLLYTNYNYNNYKIYNNGLSDSSNNLTQLTFSPEDDLINLGYEQGEYITLYHILDKKIGTNNNVLFIKDISPNRTELRLDSNILSNLDIIEQTTNFINERENTDYFVDFYINLGDNQLFIANNILLDDSDPEDPNILVKLYEPLPSEFEINDTLWIVTKIEESKSYKVIFENLPIEFDDTIKIKGPNFNLELKDKINNSTTSLSYTDLILNSTQANKDQLDSILEEKELDINIDFSDFSNFIHFSSIEERLENFYFKTQLIEEYSSSIAILDTTTSSSLQVSGSKTILEDKINNIVKNFDKYEYYLYYESSSLTYPKQNSTPPYALYSTTSSQVYTWLGSKIENSPYYGGLLLSASLYDEQNKDLLIYSIPSYLRDDSKNQNYEIFLNMIGHHFDNIWVYYKDVTTKFDNDNRINYGISRDLVTEAIKDFGIKLYQNNFTENDLFTSFIGITSQDSLFPFPNITGSLPTPSGYEYINTLISASNDIIPIDDVNRSIYKRIYHNIPYLLKSKGTIAGLKTLINTFSIPDTILNINEFGGQDKTNTNDWDYWKNEFNYAYYNNDNSITSLSPNKKTSTLSIPWAVNSDWNATSSNPQSIAFRFKPDTPTNNNSQMILNGGFATTLTYTGSFTSSSFSGSILDPSSSYGEFKFWPEYFPASASISSSITFPAYNNDWWSCLINNNSGSFTIYLKNNIYDGGNNGTSIGYQFSSSISSSIFGWNNPAVSDIYAFLLPLPLTSDWSSSFLGSIQEIRYYKEPLDEYSFDNYVMNPNSVLVNEGNELMMRASLGGELYTGSNSIHPKVTGSAPQFITSSFPSDSAYYIPTSSTFIPNTEYFFYDQPSIGIRNPISERIRLENNTLPGGDTLSAYRRITQDDNSTYSPNVNLIEIGLSPQNEINDDINSSLGYFNIGNYIGDPRYRTSGSTSYIELDKLKNNYFQKYFKNYNIYEYINLIKYFDNSLFKMIKDFIPARNSLASGIIIKQHSLERNRYPFIFPELENKQYSSSFKSQWTGYSSSSLIGFEGGTFGSPEIYNNLNTSPYGIDGNGPNNNFNLTQSWEEIIYTLSGSTLIIHDDQVEFYNGEYSGSTLSVSTQSLHQSLKQNISPTNYIPVFYHYELLDGETSNSTLPFSLINNYYTQPSNGEIQLQFGEKTFIYPSITFLILKYIKINKFDFNGKNMTSPLGQIDNIIINISYANIQCKVLNITELTNSYLYELEINYIPYLGSFITNNTQILDYNISASITSSYTFNSPLTQKIGLWDNIIGNSLNYFNTSSGEYNSGDTSNIKLHLTSSIEMTGSFMSSLIMKFYEEDPIGNTSVLFQKTYNGFGANLITITGSFTPIKSYKYYLKTTKPSPGYLGVNYANLLITQSIDPQTGSLSSVLIEPYLEDSNFYVSDKNPLLNNISENSTNNLFYDVDYSSNLLFPQNFESIISGTASPSSTQLSNYTLKRHIYPRYNGSKSTSKELNKWNEGDEGTYGKLPTIESLRTYIAYCDVVGGWPPERQNASGAWIKYLIGIDGKIIIPNISENSLTENQNNFITGEKIILLSKNTSDNTPHKIIRGASRIEPILYTQIKQPSDPNFGWATEIELTDVIPSSNSPDTTYNAQIKLNGGTPLVNSTINDEYYRASLINFVEGNALNHDNTLDGAYIVNSSVITDNINLNIRFNISNFVLLFTPSLFHITSLTIKIKRHLTLESGGNQTHLHTDEIEYSNDHMNHSTLLPLYIYPTEPNNGFPIEVLPSQLNEGDKIYVGYEVNQPGFNDALDQVYPQFSSLTIEQSPIPTSPITVATGSIWGFSDPNNYPNIITSSLAVKDTLAKYHNSPNVKQKDIDDSGFNSITLPWSIKIGDEFRFEGSEPNTYMVTNVFEIENTSSLYNNKPRITPTGSLEVHFDGNLPTGSTSFNMDHFLIRRYIDDPSQIIFEGFRPTGSSSPYIIRPEYISPELDKGIDEYIQILTEKGLI